VPSYHDYYNRPNDFVRAFFIIHLTRPLIYVCSTVCGHSFSGPAIRDYLGNSKTAKKKCPATGCKKMICKNDLKDDKDMAKRVKAAQRRLQATQDSDEDQIIE
jgi:SUMO ligase MMS21 Smc5/6 complex component